MRNKATVAVFLAVAAMSCMAEKLYTVSTEEQVDNLRKDVVQSQWIRPNDWAVSATVVSEPQTVGSYRMFTNEFTGVIMSNSTVSVYWSLSADLFTETLDETATEFNPGTVTYEPTNGGTITNGNRFVAPDAGLYRVKATSSLLGVRYCDIPLTQRQSVVSNASVYVDDSPYFWRKSVNDSFLIDLENSSNSTSSAVINGTATNSYDVWWTVRCPCRPTEGHTVQGYRSRNALSPHLMLAARHYCGGSYVVDGKSYMYNNNGSYLTFHDPIGNTNVSVASTTTWPGMLTASSPYDPVPAAEGIGYPLAAWAVEHGWTRTEVATMHIEDVMVIPVTIGTIPDACCPYIMNLEAWARHFGGQGTLGAWAFSQTYVGRRAPDGMLAGNMMTPCMLNLGHVEDGYGANTWTCAGYKWNETTTRADILARKLEMEAQGTAHAFPPIYGGDSSGGIYIKHEGRWIMVSFYTTIGSGPSLSAALPVLKKLCEAYGDTLKTIEE